MLHNKTLTAPFSSEYRLWPMSKHRRHLGDPSCGAYKPTWHSKHGSSSWPFSLYAPAPLVRPGAHRMQPSALFVPYVPCGHCLISAHTRVSSSLVKQSAFIQPGETCTEEAPSSMMIAPTAGRSQNILPALLCIHPVGHCSHWTAPVVLLNCPTEHLRQLVLPKLF